MKHTSSGQKQLTIHGMGQGLKNEEDDPPHYSALGY